MGALKEDLGEMEAFGLEERRAVEEAEQAIWIGENGSNSN